MSQKLKVLAVVDYYLPGYKGGGPAVSVSRIVGCLSQEIDFSVYTRDRDLGESQPYTSVRSGEWNDRHGINVFYARPKDINVLALLRAIRETKPDIVYLNSYFSKLTREVLLLRTFGLLRNIPILVAPRGEFSPGALQLKGLKKKLYIAWANFMTFHAGITWQVSSAHELQDAKAVIHSRAEYFIKAPDIVDRTDTKISTSRPEKTPGQARFVFISRISPKKNILAAINMLSELKGDVTFTIYGPIEDAEYWSECEDAIAQLPKNIRCEAPGGVPSAEVLEKLAGHHFFYFPTLGENFGHVIPEALTAGCPTLLSDQTPWQDFDEKHVGWIIPLNDEDSWRTELQLCVDICLLYTSPSPRDRG